MSVICITGPPVVGKSFLIKSICNELGTPELIEPQKLFRCTQYNDILCLGQYDEGTFSGTDSWSYSVLGKGVFESFIAEQVKNYRHIIWEGDRLTSKTEFLTENYDTKVFILTTSLKEEQKRQDARGNLQNKTWIGGRKTQVVNFQNNFYMREYLLIRNNDTLEDAQNIKTEIIKLLT